MTAVAAAVTAAEVTAFVAAAVSGKPARESFMPAKMTVIAVEVAAP